jgi:hypothetical protein
MMGDVGCLCEAEQECSYCRCFCEEIVAYVNMTVAVGARERVMTLISRKNTLFSTLKREEARPVPFYGPSLWWVTANEWEMRD